MRVKALNFKNNSDLTAKIVALKRLAKVRLEREMEVNLLEHEEFKILCNEYKLA
jgi:hypothetical protein